MKFIAWALVAVLTILAVRWVIERRRLRAGQLRRCTHCGRPYTGDPVYCPECGEVLKSGSSRR